MISPERKSQLRVPATAMRRRRRPWISVDVLTHLLDE